MLAGWTDGQMDKGKDGLTDGSSVIPLLGLDLDLLKLPEEAGKAVGKSGVAAMNRRRQPIFRTPLFCWKRKKKIPTPYETKKWPLLVFTFSNS